MWLVDCVIFILFENYFEIVAFEKPDEMFCMLLEKYVEAGHPLSGLTIKERGQINIVQKVSFTIINFSFIILLKLTVISKFNASQSNLANLINTYFLSAVIG